MKLIYTILFLLAGLQAGAQRLVKGNVYDVQGGQAVSFATVAVPGTTIGTNTDEQGKFEISIPKNVTMLIISYIGYTTDTLKLSEGKSQYRINLKPTGKQMDEVVITGTMKEMTRMDSPIPV